MSNNIELQFWFLFRRSRQLAWGEIFEPTELPQSNEDIADPPPLTAAIGYPEDKPEDRRLFRYNVPAAQVTEALPTLLAQAWAQVQVQYARCEVQVIGQAAPRYENRSEDLLHSIALLAVGTEVADLTWHLPMRESADKPLLANCDYGLDQEQLLLRLAPHAQPELQASLYAYAAKPRTEANVAKINHWQVQLSGVNAPCLVELQTGEDDNHPVFNLFALDCSAWQEHPSALEQLQTFAVFDSTNCGYSPLMFLLSPCLMKSWQYGHIETASRRLDKRLKQHNHAYKERSDLALRCASREALEQDLQTMQGLEAEAHYERGRIAQALRTLQINRDTLLENQRFLTNDLAGEWQFDWQWYDAPLQALQQQRDGLPPSAAAQPALLKDFEYVSEELHNLQTYLQGKLTHLQGSKERWQVALEKQRLELYEKLGHIGHAIILLVALAEMGHVIHNATSGKYAAAHAAHESGGGMWQALLNALHGFDNSPPMHILATLLQSPTLFVGLVLLIILPVLRAWGRYEWRRAREHREHRRANQTRQSS